MRVLILLCFMVLLCSCIGTLINLTSLNSRAIKMLRRNAVPSIMCVFWVIAIVGVCYYTTVVLGNTNNSDPNTIQVDYEYGFYTITAAGEKWDLIFPNFGWNLWVISENLGTIEMVVLKHRHLILLGFPLLTVFL